MERFLKEQALGYEGEAIGEVVFNTAMTGYQEILTDPSYKGQMVLMTCPQIGNYGINSEDIGVTDEFGRTALLLTRQLQFRATGAQDCLYSSI